MQDQVNAFIEAMADHGVHLADTTEIIADDKIRRAHTVDDKRGKTSLSYQLEVTADGFGFGWFAAWKAGNDPVYWHSKPPRGQTSAVRKKARDWADQRREQRKAEADDAFRWCLADLEVYQRDSVSADGHGYLTRKGVHAGSLRQHEGKLLVPITSGDGSTGCQLITADGMRWFITGSKKSGSWHLIAGETECYDRVFIVEGLSTGLTVRDVSGCPVYVAIDAGNLKAVAVRVREMHPDAQIIIAGDNDIWKRDDKGQPLNTGRKAAEQAAVSSNAVMWLPEGLEHPGTDWNDAAAHKGVDWVRNELAKIPLLTWGAADDVGEYDRYDEYDAIDASTTGTPIDILAEKVNPLGYNDGVFYFLPERIGQVVELTTSQIATVTNLLYLAPRSTYALMGIDADKNSAITDRVPDNLMSLCISRGIYEPSRVFGVGAWMDGGKFRLNCGDKVWCGDDSRFRSHSEVTGAGFYIKSRKRYDLDCLPLKNSEAYKLREICERLVWRRKMSGVLLAGWLVIAPVGGALRWRPHVFLTGEAGSGKTSVVEQIVTPMLGTTAIRMDGGSTEAGLRATVRDGSNPVFMDEFESENKSDAQNVQRILNWTRKASSGGVTVNANDSYRSQSCVFFSAINPAITQRADVDRNTLLELVKNTRDEREKDWQDILDMIYDVIKPDYANRMIRRTVDNIDSLLHNCEVFSKEASKILGSARAGDQYGPMLAGAYMLGSTGRVSPEQARDWCDKQDWSWHFDGVDGTDSERLLQRIMTSMVDHTFLDRTGKMSVSDLIERVMNDSEGAKDAVKTLGRIGIAIRDDRLCFANKNSRLSDLLVGTAWVEYRPSLSRHPGCVVADKPMWFSGGTGSQRYIDLPLMDITGMGVAEEELPLYAYDMEGFK